MRAWMVIATMVATSAATPLFAQESGPGNSRAYISGYGGFASAVGHTTGDVLVEGGVRVLPHIKVFADFGRFSNLQSELQPTLDSTANTLSANQGLALTGGGSIPAWYGQGGVRVDVPTGTRVLPFVLGGVGVARLNFTPQFLFASGTLPDGTTPVSGTDVTATIMTSGLFTTPPSSSALMLTFGGGVQVPVAPHWAVEAGYRYSHIGADSTLGASPLSANGMTFGIGYHF
jgi:opacity protein-like surface antigen